MRVSGVRCIERLHTHARSRGHAKRASADTSQLGNRPVAACAVHLAKPSAITASCARTQAKEVTKEITGLIDDENFARRREKLLTFRAR